MKIKINYRKIRNQPAIQTSIFVQREDGSTHSKSFVTHGNNARQVAKGQAKMFLRNISQKANFVVMDKWG